MDRMYMWVPQVGSCARMDQVWHGGKGTKVPGVAPCPFGSWDMANGSPVRRPPPGGHSTCRNPARATQGG
eukprot:5557503-Prymnesium_polylepis.2